MGFIKNLIKNRRLIWRMSRNDFRNKFSSMSLGSIWGFITPLFFMGIYFVIFKFVLKSPDLVSPSGVQIPYIVWFLSGFSMWLFISDGIMSATGSIRSYSYLVKKTVFNVDIIPVFALLSNGIVALTVFVIATVVCCLFVLPNFLIILYMIIAAFIFLMALTRLTSALATMVADITAVINILIQMVFWFTAILWDIARIDQMVPALGIVLRCSPFTYLVYGFRQAFTKDLTPIITEHYGMYTAIFWVITVLVFIYGNYVFNKNKKEFADVL